jgi:hypothetical protein
LECIIVPSISTGKSILVVTSSSITLISVPKPVMLGFYTLCDTLGLSVCVTFLNTISLAVCVTFLDALGFTGGKGFFIGGKLHRTALRGVRLNGGNARICFIS